MSCGNCIGTGEKIVNFAKAMARAAKAFAVGDPVFVTPEQWKARLAVCVDCEHFQPATSTEKPHCNLCGCPLRENRNKASIKEKAWLATEVCPDTPPRWPSV